MTTYEHCVTLGVKRKDSPPHCRCRKEGKDASADLRQYSQRGAFFVQGFRRTQGTFGERNITMGFFSKLFGQKTDELFAPVAGNAVPVAEVPDPTFSSGMLGDGVAIEPTDGKICAPCDATVDTMFDTGHAVSLVADCGAEILIHVGLETVGLQGKGFTIHAQNGQKVKKGDLLIEVDLEAVKAAGLNTITPMLVCNSSDYSTFEKTTGKPVTNDDAVIRLAK